MATDIGYGIIASTCIYFLLFIITYIRHKRKSSKYRIKEVSNWAEAIYHIVNDIDHNITMHIYALEQNGQQVTHIKTIQCSFVLTEMKELLVKVPETKITYDEIVSKSKSNSNTITCVFGIDIGNTFYSISPTIEPIHVNENQSIILK